ncbi:uncharacterized protein isoform X1 [Choristoneura fumiferana]|uniref:uncharacterized protein isoform X1 n=1 Tax=Choristoneura fumiferana TaxID=7141 RepID=UPI003D15C1AF
MLSALIILALSTSITNAQIDGEFWWLKDKLAEIKGVKPDPVKYEEVSEFENDETDKVVFRDKNTADDGTSDRANGWNFRFQDHTQLTWPDERRAKATKVQSTTTKPSENNDDVLNFKFPDSDNYIWKDVINASRKNVPSNSTTDNTTKNKTILITDNVTFKVYKQETTQVQNICTYLKKSECKRRNGLIYVKREGQIPKKPATESQFICCILPLPSDKPSQIYFADDNLVNQRFKRSTNNGDSMSSALKQRNALMLRKFAIPKRNLKAPMSTMATKVTQKIVTPEDDYVDPYANIKTSNFKNQYVPNNPYQVTSTQYEYGNQDYVEDYIVELPRPGLVGLYSDHGHGSTWTFGGGKTDSPYGTIDDTDLVEDDPAPGYSTFDPRLVDRKVTGISKSSTQKPMKFSTDDSDEFSYDSQSQTVNFHSNPDFQVLRGFKLLNFFRNTSRIYSKNGRKTTTTERVRDSSECINTQPVLVQSSEEAFYDDVFDVNDGIFKECGKAVKDPLKDCEHDKQMGEADIGSHPWLALAVLTKSPQSILCYAALVHPRAAVTAADCVYGRTSSGEVTLLAGIWDLEDSESIRSQQRMVSIHIDQQYKPGNLAHNLAMLHWKRPLSLGVNVQPACIADPHVGDECKLVGWGGYDQAIRTRPRWQRASILTPRQCNERLSSSNRRVTLPPDTFCASVEAKTTVTGVGGPLTCSAGGRHAVVGVAVWRDSALLLLPAHEWAARAAAALRIR